METTNTTTYYRSREAFAASVMRAEEAVAGSVEDHDGARQVRPGAFAAAGGVEGMVNDIFNRTCVEEALGKKEIKMAKDFRQATGEWGVCLQARLAAAKLRFMTHFTTGGTTGINIIHMPFRLKKIPTDDECQAWHMFWEDNAPFDTMVSKTFEGFDVIHTPSIIHTGDPKQPIMFSVAVGVRVKEGEAKEEDPVEAMD